MTTISEKYVQESTYSLAIEAGYTPANSHPLCPQHLLSTWLRETQCLHVAVNFNQDNTWYEYLVVSTTSKKPKLFQSWFNSYEEALENGICAALKYVLNNITNSDSTVTVEATIQDLKKDDRFKFNRNTFVVTRKFIDDDRPLIAYKENDIHKEKEKFDYEGLEIEKLPRLQ